MMHDWVFTAMKHVGLWSIPIVGLLASTMQDYSNFIGQVGFPVAFLLFMGLASWRVLVWFRPLAERWINGNIEFMDRTGRFVESADETLRETSVTLRQMQSTLNEMSVAIHHHGSVVDDASNQIADLKQSVAQLQKTEHRRAERDDRQDQNR